MRRLTGVNPCLFFLLAAMVLVLPRLSRAASDCDNQGGCLDVTLDSKSGRVDVKNKCERAVICELCPSFGADVAIDQCRTVEFMPRVEGSRVDFPQRVSRLNRVCLWSDAFKACRTSATTVESATSIQQAEEERQKELAAQEKAAADAKAAEAERAAADCEPRSSCITVVLDPKSGRVEVKNSCDQAVQCELCPSFGADVALDQCRTVDVETGATPTEVVFTRKVSRLNRVCLLKESAAICRGPQKGAGWKEAAADAKAKGLRAAEQQRRQRSFESLDAMRGGSRAATRRQLPEQSLSAPEWSGRTATNIEVMGAVGFSSFEQTVGDVRTSSSVIAFGSAARFSIVSLGSPSSEGTWFGFRIGAGADPTIQAVTTRIAFRGISESASATAFLLKVPLFLGLQVMPGSYKSPELWKGMTLGIDYMPFLSFGSGGSGFHPVGFNLRLASSSLRPNNSTEGNSAHFNLNLHFAPPVGERPWLATVGLGAIWM